MAFAVAEVQAQLPINPIDIEFRVLDMSQGRAAGIGPVTAIIEDQHGFMWFGGEDGLVRFDGERYKYFYADETDPNAVGRYRINDLKIDKVGQLWVATTEGISLYDAVQDKFIPYGTENKDFSSAIAWELSVDVYNNIYIASSVGLYTLPSNRSGISLVWGAEELKGKIREVSARSVFVDSKQRLWVGGEKGVILYDPYTKRFRYWNKDLDNKRALMSNSINSLFEDSSGHFWLMTQGGGVSRISSNFESVKNYVHDKNDKSSISINEIWDATEDAEGNIWFSTDHGGINIYQYNTDSFTHLNHQQGTPGSLISNQVRTIYVDSHEDMWVGFFPSGIAFYNTEKKSIRKYIHNPLAPNSLSNNGVLKVIEDSKERVWVGTENGLNVLNKEGSHFKHYFADKDDHSALASSTILTAIEDYDESLWVGTWGGGLHKLDSKTDKFKRYQVSQKEVHGFEGVYVWVTFLDSSNNLWVGNEKAGLALYDREKDKFNHYTADPSNPKAISHNLIWKIIEEKPGQLLIATGYGLNRLDVNKKVFTRIDDSNEVLNRHYFRSLVKLDNSEIWIGTEDVGVIIMNPEDDTYVLDAKLNAQLPNLSVVSMVQDFKGFVWATTTNGVAIIDPNDRSVIVLNENDGLAGSQFNRDATLVASDGKIYLGGTGGISVFSRKPELDFSYYLTPRINQFKLFNKNVRVGQEGSPLSKSILHSDEITLRHNQSVITFGYTGKNYRYPKKTQYSYKLEGFEEHWNNVVEQDSATYTNLNAGKYTFKVKASWHEEIEMKEIDSVDIIVKPPKWLAWYANVIYLFFGMLAVYLFFSFKFSRQRKEGDDKLIREKNELLVTMGNGFNAPLSAILGMLDFSLKDKDLKESTKQQLDIARTNALSLKTMIDDILGLSLIEPGNISLKKSSFEIRELIKDTFNTFSGQASEKLIDYSYTVEDDVPGVVVGDTQRLIQILSGLIDNALKFTERGYVKITVSLEGLEYSTERTQTATIGIIVSDSGIGISETFIEHVFQKFQRVDEFNSGKYTGTDMGLSVCKTLTEAMGGAIDVESHFGKGAKFSVLIPFRVSNLGQLVIKRQSHKLRILCAEDNKANQIFIKNYIEEMGHDITVVENGLLALEALSKQKYDVVFMDGRMPVLDGHEVVRIIRGGGTNELRIIDPEVYIVALTSSLNNNDKGMFKRVGVLDCINKPVKPSELSSVLEKVIEFHLKNN